MRPRFFFFLLLLLAASLCHSFLCCFWVCFSLCWSARAAAAGELGGLALCPRWPKPRSVGLTPVRSSLLPGEVKPCLGPVPCYRDTEA